MTARPQEYNQQLLAQDSRTRLERQLAEQGAKLIDWKNEHELKSAASKNYRRSAATGTTGEQGGRSGRRTGYNPKRRRPDYHLRHRDRRRILWQAACQESI